MGKFIDETGHKFGRLTVLYKIDNTSPIKWHCQCECGKTVDVIGSSLRNGNTQSCGCLKHERIQEANKKRGITHKPGDQINQLTILENMETTVLCKCICGKEIILNKNDVYRGHTKTCGCKINLISPHFIDETGNKYGKLTVLTRMKNNKNGNAQWLCKCECGNTKITTGKSLRLGLTQSCGCIHSKGEEKISTILTILKIKFEKQHTFKWLINPMNNYHLYCDFYLPDYNIVIEYQGEQHYTTYEQRGFFDKQTCKELQFRDQLKHKLCLEHKIKFITIPYTDFELLNKEYMLEVIK